MKTNIVALVFALLCLSGKAGAQISHGGAPLPLTTLKSSSADKFVEMPAFDVAEELRIDSLNESDFRSGYRFAYKFMTSLNIKNAGTSFTLADGTKVWRLGIRSADALSINVLFSEYELPKGGQVFLYNPGQTQILGSFTHLNNSKLNILPVSPVMGDELIIEYQEPANAEFSGRLVVGEVNHAYRELRGDEPRANTGSYYCMDNLVCDPNYDNQYEEVGRSVVMLMIDGTIACSGTLVNNTENDGVPYLLTASHCLNNKFKVTNPDYAKVAGSIVCYFNYNSPICSTALRGTEEQSMASATPCAINEKTDLALLALMEIPPVYYRPYYAGWNAKDAGISPYSAIHHPGGSVKRINKYSGELSLASFSITGADFIENGHWHIPRWSDGSTATGSSGSPLFDAEDMIVGALSGGSSYCMTIPGSPIFKGPINDYYYALKESWNPDTTETLRLRYWLNPRGTIQNTSYGLDPYSDSTCIRLSNFTANGNRDNIEALKIALPDSGYVFGTNSTNTESFAEGYSISGQFARVYGTFLVTPAAIGDWTNSKVTLAVYSGNGRPERLIHTQVFKPKYTNYNTESLSFDETDKPLNRDMETFVPFTSDVVVENEFYISYTIENAQGDTFAIYNLKSGKTARNTAWIKRQGVWEAASNVVDFSTSLFIDPVIQYISDPDDLPTGIKPEDINPAIQVFTSMDRRQLYIVATGNTESVHVNLLSASGKMIQSNVYHSDNITMPLNNLASGIYVVQVRIGKKQFSKKIVL